MIERGRLFACLALVGCANGTSEHVARSIANDGLALSLFNLFGVNIAVWAAMFVTIWFLTRPDPQRATPSDFAIAAIASIAFLIPIPALSWLALGLIGIWLYGLSARATALHSAAVVLFAMTVPMLWARLVLAAFSNQILGIDAKLIGWVVGTGNVNNGVPFHDGSGMLFLEPACSSLTNMSIAFLGGVLLVEIYRLKWSPALVLTIAGAALATVVINVLRISFMAVSPAYYVALHGPTGALIVEWLTIVCVLAIYLWRVEATKNVALRA